jgi:Flp pilus assembly protein CpaB
VAAPKRSNNLLIIIGLVFLLVGAGLVVVLLRDDGNGSSGSGSGAQAGADLVDVVVSKVAIPRGTTAKDFADKVELRKVAAVTRPSDAITSLSELSDRTAQVDIGAGQQLRSAFFQQAALRSNIIKIPDGKQAMAVTVPFTPAVAGYVAQGDNVNVFATMTTKGDQVIPPCAAGLCENPAGNQPSATARLVLSNIPVLDVSQEVAPTASGSTTATTTAPGTTGRPIGPPTITYLLAVDSSQAERLVFFTSYASIYLSLVPQGQAATQQGAGRNQTSVLNP